MGGITLKQRRRLRRPISALDLAVTIDKLPTLLALVPAAALLCSVSYWFGFFFILDLNFVGFFTISDLLSTAVTWLPIAALFLTIEWVLVVDAHRHSSGRDSNISDRRHSIFGRSSSDARRKSRNWMLASGFFAAVPFTYGILIQPNIIIFSVGMLFGFASLYYAFFVRVSPTREFQVLLVVSIVLIISTSFSIGVGLAHVKLLIHPKSNVIVYNDRSNDRVAIVASLSRGMIVIDQDRVMRFISGSEIREVSKSLSHVRAFDGLLCRIYPTICPADRRYGRE